MDAVEVAVIGGGPAGLTAALYAARAGRRVALIEKLMPGGQAALTARIDNYPGFPGGVDGAELANKMFEQCMAHGVQFVGGQVQAITTGDQVVIQLDADTLNCQALIIASGSSPRRLQVPGEAQLIGRGVSFCATCDGPLYRGKHVAVVGGGDAAVEEALFLARFADKVTIIHRRDQLRAVKVLADRALAEPRIDVLWNGVVVELVGDSHLEEVVVRDVVTDKESRIAAAGLFVYIGADPDTGFLPDTVERDAGGYVITDQGMRTSVPGVFACGDVRATLLRQVATAVGDGAMAGAMADRYLSDH